MKHNQFKSEPKLCYISLLLIVSSCCSLTNINHPEKFPKQELASEIKIKPLSSNTAQEKLIESIPFELIINIESKVQNGRCCKSVFDELKNTHINLNELRYRLLDEAGMNYFTDTINLYGLAGEGKIVIRPGLTLPEFSSKISVEAELDYKYITSNSACEITDVPATIKMNDKKAIDLQGEPGRYERIRTAYIKRHLLENGRHLSWVWLKEYEPNLDRKELLYHSRTIRLPNEDKTRVLIPWLYNCGENCGSSIQEDSETIHAGHENPLLRGGIAMAVFSLEALKYQSDNTLSKYKKQELEKNSLSNALTLLNYFEECEWKDYNGRRTGFFLRSRGPGDLYEESEPKREYFYASADELIGMTLGLYHLHNALKVLGFPIEIQRVEGLINRMGTQLQGNQYLIIPFQRKLIERYITSNGEILSTQKAPEWNTIGLPLERHKGYYGLVGYEWFLVRAFQSITGQNYMSPYKSGKFWGADVEVPFLSLVESYAETIKENFNLPPFTPIAQIAGLIDNLEILNLLKDISTIDRFVPYYVEEFASFMNQVNLSKDFSDKDPFNINLITSLVDLSKLSAYNRALLMIKSIGYLSIFDGMTNEEILSNLGMNLVDIYPRYFDLGSDFLDEKFSFDRWNIPLLFHAFQFANPIGTSPQEMEIRLEVAKLSRGLISDGTTKTRLILKDILNIAHSEISILRDVGLNGHDYDYYVASIAKNYKLANDLSNNEDRTALLSGIENCIAEAENNYYESAPLGAPKTCSINILNFCNNNGDCDKADGTCEHWPRLYITDDQKRFGQAFCWEKKSNNRYQDAKVDSKIERDLLDLYIRGLNNVRGRTYAAFKEGAGLGYLLPYVIVHDKLPAYLNYSGTQRLPVCYTNPVICAKTNVSSSIQCNFKFDKYKVDDFDMLRRNDRYQSASDIQFGINQIFSIDKETSLNYTTKYADFVSKEGYSVSIPIEADYDFYNLYNPKKSKIYLTFRYLHYSGENHKSLYIDGHKIDQPESPCGGSESCLESTIEIMGKEKYLFMVTGGIGPYELSIEPISTLTD